MWKRTKEEEEQMQSRPEPPARPVGGMPAADPAVPVPAAAPRISRSEATIGKSVIIKGQVFSEEDLHLDGQIEGTLDLPKNRLSVGKSGKIQASIRARDVDIHGTVNGNVEATEKIIIRSNANLVGDLRCATISIEDGAYFKGGIDIVRQAPAKPAVEMPAPKPAAAPAQSTPNVRSAAAQAGGGPQRG